MHTNKELHRLRFLLQDLAGWGSGVVWPHLSLPRDHYQRLACLPEESFPTRSLCREDAERRVQELCQAAKEQFYTCCDPLAPRSFLVTFQSTLNEKLAQLKEELGQYHTSSTAALVNRLTLMLNPAEVFQELETFNSRLREKFALPGADTYTAKLTYDTWDPSEGEEGLGWLVAKVFCRFGYNLLPVIQALEVDGAEHLAAFQKAFDAKAALSVTAHIVSPIQDKLPLLEMKLREEY